MGSGTGQRRRNYDACSRIPVGKFDDHLGRGKKENASEAFSAGYYMTQGETHDIIK